MNGTSISAVCAVVPQYASNRSSNSGNGRGGDASATTSLNEARLDRRKPASERRLALVATDEDEPCRPLV